MKIIFTFLGLIFSVSSICQSTNYDVLIKNVSYVDVTTSVITKANAYIKDGQPATFVPLKNALKNADITIDAKGKFMMPALYDMHVHFPETDIQRFFYLQTVAGIANSRIMKSTESTVSFASNAQKSPTLHIAYNIYGSEELSIDSLPSLISHLKNRGYEFIKLFGVPNEDYFDAIISEAKKNNITVCGHALGKINAKKLLAGGYKSIEHVGYFDRAKSPAALDTLIEIAAKNNVFICPTLDWTMMVYHTMPEDSLKYRAGYAIGKKLYGKEWEKAYAKTTKKIPETKVQEYADMIHADFAKKIDVLKKMRAKGIKIIAGSDAEEPYQTPGFSLIDELRWIQQAGFTNAELLQMVTTNAAAFFNTKINTDYILLSKNPLQNIGNLESVDYVIKGNEVIDTKKLLEKIK